MTHIFAVCRRAARACDERSRSRRDHHRRRRDRHRDRVRAGQARLQDAQHRQAAVRRLRPDEQLVRDRARPLLLARRRGDGLRGLLLLEGLGRLPRRAGRVGPRAGTCSPARSCSRAPPATTTRCCRTTTTSACSTRSGTRADARATVPIFDVHEFWPPVAARATPTSGTARRASSPARSTRPTPATSTIPRSPSHNLQRAAEAKGGEFLLPAQGDRDPPGRRHGARASRSTTATRDRRADRRQRRRPALVRDQPHGRRRGRHEDQDEGAAPRGAPRALAARTSTSRRTATTSPTATTASTSGPRPATTS